MLVMDKKCCEERLAEENVIYFELLGLFSYGGMTSSLKVGKKTLSFLQYLIVNHDRSISSEELIEQFWTEGGSNAPGGALRHMVFKVRGILESMFPKSENLLLTFPGCYVWNPKIMLRLDIELFEKACLEARKASGEEKYRLLLEAIGLYRGGFLLGNDSEWVQVPRQYYHTLYLDSCKEILPLLYKKECWTDIINICGQAYTADFAIEDFTIYQIRALIALGQPEQAIEKYETFRDKILKEYEMMPSASAEQLYTLALGLRKKEGKELDIFNLVCEAEEEQQGAFFCTFEVFQRIVALEKRHLERSGQKATLVIISLGQEAVPITDARRLERILTQGLRDGDPVARLEANSYILMLAGAGIENARLVMNRIDINFHKIYRHSNARLTYRLSLLDAQNRN